MYLSTLLKPTNEVWGKVIFSQACVQNSVHRGGAIPACIAVVSQHALQQVSGVGVLSQHALQVVSQHALPQVSGGVPAPGGLLPKGVCSQGGSAPRGGGAWWRHPPAQDGYCCGQYTYYWNSFLLCYDFNVLLFDSAICSITIFCITSYNMSFNFYLGDANCVTTCTCGRDFFQRGNWLQNWNRILLCT